jgi:hypothetical protein
VFYSQHRFESIMNEKMSIADGALAHWVLGLKPQDDCPIPIHELKLVATMPKTLPLPSGRGTKMTPTSHGALAHQVVVLKPPRWFFHFTPRAKARGNHGQKIATTFRSWNENNAQSHGALAHWLPGLNPKDFFDSNPPSQLTRTYQLLRSKVLMKRLIRFVSNTSQRKTLIDFPYSNRYIHSKSNI